MSGGGPDIAVVGPGAIGGALAGSVFQAGTRPLVCARTPISELIVDHPDGRIRVELDCVTDPAGLKPAELVIVAVKAHQTDSAAGWLRALVGRDTTVVIAQNGVEHIERVRPLVPEAATLVPAVIWCPARRPTPGHVEVTGPAFLTVPEGPGTAELIAALRGSFFGVRVSSKWTSRAWDKLLINAALGGLGVLTGRSGAALCADPPTREFMLALMAEAATVGRAEGAEILAERPASILDGVVGRGEHLSSITVDRLAGRPTEWDARNAVIERLAERHGIDVPLNRWLTAAIRMGEPHHASEVTRSA